MRAGDRVGIGVMKRFDWVGMGVDRGVDWGFERGNRGLVFVWSKLVLLGDR
jgi:hypothetical protein